MTHLRSAPLRRCLAWLAPVAFTVTLAAQIQVRYGDPARQGTITTVNETQRYLLLGAQQGDILRLTFASQNSGYPSYSYFHQIDIWQGTTHIGDVQGYGVLTLTIPATGYYTLDVRARNGQSTGWYAFQLDRLNDAVIANPTTFNWNVANSITAATQFHIYTLHATANGTANLRFTCQNSGYPNYYYYHFVELLDDTGTRVAAVNGNGSTPVTFSASGTYTLFVAARNYQDGGWYNVAVDCQSWPFSPCDTLAHTGNYGTGSAGTNGAPTLTASTTPRIGSTLTVQVGNSYGQTTSAWLLIGPGSANVPLAAYGATLLVAYPSVLLLTLPAAGTPVNFALPNDPLLLGIGAAMQSVVADPGATGGVAFSRGLLVGMGQ